MGGGENNWLERHFQCQQERVGENSQHTVRDKRARFSLRKTEVMAKHKSKEVKVMGRGLKEPALGVVFSFQRDAHFTSSTTSSPNANDVTPHLSLLQINK